ncbi:MAG: type II toxin-antitoxin system VapC family toxin [Isosphaeraceae bacterium]
MKYLLDTDHISILQQQSGREFAILSARISRESRSDLGFSVVSFHEQVLGSHAYINRARKAEEVVRGYAMMARILRQFAAAPVVTFDEGAAVVFDGLGARRLRVDAMDLRIASIALSRRLVLLTRNTADFARVPDLIAEDWTR